MPINFREFLKTSPILWPEIIRHTCADNPARFWRQMLYAAFWLYLALFPIGYGWREVMPPLCLIFLMLFYHYGWRESALCRLKPWWLFLFGGAMLLEGVIFSINPLASIMHAGTVLNKGLLLPFIAMECASSLKSLRGLVWALVFACFWQGLDGIFQALQGHDFIMGYPPNNGRLTGSLGDYTVGNYLALAMVPACAIWFMLKRFLPLAANLLIFTALLWPAAFLFVGASSRSGMLAIAGSLCLWQIISHKRFNMGVILAPFCIVAAFILLQPHRLLPESIVQDNRWDLWKLGWQVFTQYPLLGSGAGTYNEAFRGLGLAPAQEAITISHPHNLYLDILYAHGISGFILGMIFLGGFLIWGYRHIRQNLLATFVEDSQKLYWQITAWFWLGYAAWFINGIFGHDFYRTWWLAQAMIAQGIMIGAIVNAPLNNSDNSC